MVDRDEYTGVVDNKNLFIVYTLRGETVRMISARSATKRVEYNGRVIGCICRPNSRTCTDF